MGKFASNKLKTTQTQNFRNQNLLKIAPNDIET